MLYKNVCPSWTIVLVGLKIGPVKLVNLPGALPLFRILGLPKFRIFAYQSKTALTGSRQGKTGHNLSCCVLILSFYSLYAIFKRISLAHIV